MYGKEVLGYAFGKDFAGSVMICLAKPEIVAAGMECNGPCINRMVATSDVTFLDPTKFKMVVEEEEVEDELELDANHSSGDPDPDDNLVLDMGPLKKEKKQRQKKMKAKRK